MTKPLENQVTIPFASAKILGFEASVIPRPIATLVEDPRILSSMEQLKTHPEVNRLLDQLWRKDPETFLHCHRVADMAQATGKDLGLSAQERVELYLCGLLHDLGKILTPDSVLKKPAALTVEEFAIMKLHPVDSGRLVATIPDLGHLAPAIRGHHERIDGRGYPDSKKGDKIPFFSRVILVADTYDAMANNRVYRAKLNLEKIYDELIRWSDTQFDKAAAAAFIAVHQRLMLEDASANPASTTISDKEKVAA